MENNQTQVFLTFISIQDHQQKFGKNAWSNHEDLRLLKADLDSLVDLARDWRMMFHPEKYKTMIFDRRNKLSPADGIFTMKTLDSGIS